MLPNKLLFIVTKTDYIKKAKEVGINTFLFPLKEYCVGYDEEYALDDISLPNSYIYINRVLNNNDIDALKELLNELPNNIKGIVFEDLGLIEVLKDYRLEKILFNHHLSTNYKSINYYLESLDSLVISTDITENEIHEIIKRATKKLCLFAFGMIPLMYSRRTLVTNYKKFYKYNNNISKIKENIYQKEFILKENKYGTVVYPNAFYNNLSMINDELLYGIINPLLLNNNEVNDLLNCLDNNDYELSTLNVLKTDGFLHQKTIFKLPPREGQNE